MWNSRMEYSPMGVMEQQAHVPYLALVAGAWSSWNRKWISGTWNSPWNDPSQSLLEGRINRLCEGCSMGD